MLKIIATVSPFSRRLLIYINSIDNRGCEAPGIGVFKFSHVLSAPRPQDDATIFQSKTSTADLKFLSIT